MAIVFVITFSNCGLTLQALATSDGISLFGFSLFGKNNLSYKAYFLDENGKEKNEMQADVNGKMTLILELEPKEIGYLKTGTIKAVTDEGEPNFKFEEILNLSSNNEKKEDTLEQAVQLEETLLQTGQVVNADLPEVELTLPTNENTTSSENTIANEIANDVTNNVVENEENTAVVDNANTVTSDNTNVQDMEPADGQAAENIIPTDGKTVDNQEQEDVLVDEDKVYEDEAKQKENNDVIPVSAISAKINSDNEILVENVAENTKIYVKLAYKAGETLNVSDLYKQTNLDLFGTYINEDLEEVEVSSTDKITTEWTYSKDINVSTEITKVSPFEVEGTKGTLVESKIVVNRDCTEENYLPLKETVIEFEAPLINGKSPITLDVRATKLKATSGEEINEITFSSDNWEYNADKNIITIKVENNNAVLTSGEDIYVIVYRYDEYVESQEISVDLKGKVTVEEFSGKENNIITKDFSGEKKTIVNIGELITYSIGTTEDLISKGKINANYNSVEAVYDTEFTSTVSINILTNDILKEFTLKDTKEYYIDKTNLEFEAQDVLYKEVKFKYAEIAEILNQGGTIEIKSSTGEVLHTLNASIVSSQEDCELVLNGDIHGVEISVKDIKVNGTITVDFVKSIGKCAYEKATFNNFEKIESRVKAQVKYGTSDEVIELTPLKAEKYFEKSYTKAEISMNTTQLSTIADNENVELKIELNNNTDKSDLYINPEFEIVFPSYIRDVEVKSVNLLYEEGLTVKNISLFKDANNIQRMKIQLEGVQREFSTSEITNGTNIIVNTKIVVDDYTPKKDDQLKMYYFNQGVTNYQSQTDWKISSGIPDGIIKTTNGFDIEVFSFQAPSGFITANGIENYDGMGSTIQTIKQGEVTAKAEMGTLTRDVIMTLAALNNTGNDCTDVAMLGRVPNTEATDVITGANIGTNRDTHMVTGITQSDINPIGCDIYYSYNPKADISLSNGANGWTKTPEDMSQVKSYLIVPTSTVKAGTLFKFEYNFQVPANLPYEVEMYGSFGAYYNNHTDLAIVYESTKADLVGLVTEAGPKIEANLSVDVGDGAVVNTSRKLKYTITVVNSGSITADNIVINAPIPKYTNYTTKKQSSNFGDYGYEEDPVTRELTFNIEKIEPGQTKEFSYEVRAGRNPNTEKYVAGETVPEVYITNKVVLDVPILANKIETNEVKNELKISNFSMDLTLDYERELIAGQESNFQLSIQNISKRDLKNVVAVFNVGKIYEYNSAMINDVAADATYDSEEGKIYINIKDFEKDSIKVINVKVFSKKINKGIEKFDCRFEVTADGGEKEYSTAIPQTIVKSVLEAKDITINLPQTITEGNVVTISTQITNIGGGSCTEGSYEFEVISDAVDVENVISGTNGYLDTGGGTGKAESMLSVIPVNESRTVDLVLRAKNMPGTDSAKVVVNRIIHNVEQEDIKLAPVEFTVINDKKTEEEQEQERIEQAEKEYEEQKKKEEEEERNNTENNDSNNGATPDNNIPTPEPPLNNNNSNNNNNTQEPNNTPNEENKTPEPEAQKYYITGRAWFDENKDGSREDNEKGLESIQVYLLTSANSVLRTTTTNGNGIYAFDNVENGKYIVAFNYDNKVYTTTIYKKADVGEDRNSDVIESNSGNMNAISNSITVDHDIENIDIGLQNRDTFDLQISKYLSKARVTTKKGTKEYNYNNVDLAKIDIHSKQVKGAKVELEYTITLENTGSLEGYAEQVIDYIGTDIEFDENQNKDWYKGNDGYIYMKNINQTTLNPGQKKEYKIVLTKTMTTENTGTISNKVEILKALSNSAESEKADNNISVQNTIITISTGRTLRNVIIIIFIIGVLAGLGYNQKLTIDIHFDKVYKAKNKKISLKKFYK